MMMIKSSRDLSNDLPKHGSPQGHDLDLCWSLVCKEAFLAHIPLVSLRVPTMYAKHPAVPTAMLPEITDAPLLARQAGAAFPFPVDGGVGAQRLCDGPRADIWAIPGFAHRGVQQSFNTPWGEPIEGAIVLVRDVCDQSPEGSPDRQSPYRGFSVSIDEVVKPFRHLMPVPGPQLNVFQVAALAARPAVKVRCTTGGHQMLGMFLQDRLGMSLVTDADIRTAVVHVVALVTERLRQNTVVGNFWKGLAAIGSVGHCEH